MTFLLLESILILLLFIAANNELKYIYAANGKQVPKTYKEYNIDIIDMSINSLFKTSETTTFLYPITILLSQITLLSFFYINNIHTKFLYEFIIITGILVSLHIIVPYYFFYLKKKEESLIYGFTFKEWITISTKTIIREKSDITINLIPLKTLQTKNTYEEYKKHTKDYALDVNKYYKLIPFMNPSNIFFEIDTEVYESVEDKTYKISQGFTNMHLSIFKEIDLLKMLNMRYLEIISFFIIINLILNLGGYK